MKISIITVTWNAHATLADTLESVARQTGPMVEHLLIDGGSTDDTLQVAHQHGTHLAKIVSESDRGLYDAMNKGARLSTGDVIGFLNADDWYARPEALQWVADAFEKGADIVHGDLALIDERPPYAVRRVWRDGQRTPRDFFRLGWQPPHPATFVRRSIFQAAGGFDLRWKISADYAFFAHAMRIPGVRLSYVPHVLVNMRTGGASTAGAGAVREGNGECVRALAELGVRWPWAIIGAKLARKCLQLVRARSTFVANATVWRPWDTRFPHSSHLPSDSPTASS